MKSKLLFTVLIICIASTINAQEKCGTTQVENEMLESYPFLRQKAEESERRNAEWMRTRGNTKFPESNLQERLATVKSGTPSMQSLCGYSNVYYTTIAAPTTVGQTVTPLPDNCVYGGEYVTVTGMVAGNIYEVKTCSTNTFDTQLTIYTLGGGLAVAHNDDLCGSQSSILFNPLTSGDYDVLVNEYDCVSNSICASLEVKLIYTPRPVLTIPVIVHVVYKNTTENISTAQIQSQIDVLNQDFRRVNSNFSITPAAFRGLSDDPLIEFCLAQQDPNGVASNGITRTSTTEPDFTSSTDRVKFTSTGGEDAWNAGAYLNLWVCDIQGGGLGYAHFPWMLTSFPLTDGVVIDFAYFGSTGTATAPYDLGKTATHEVGHWLNLRHIWGDETACAQDDSVADTPMQEGPSGGFPTFPIVDLCSQYYPGAMFYNYMDYSDDAALTIFTIGQTVRMDASLFTERSSLATSIGCQPGSSGINDLNNSADVSIFPNPNNGNFSFQFHSAQLRNISIRICNLIGEVVWEISQLENNEKLIDVDLSNQPSGIYFSQIQVGQQRSVQKIVLQR